MNTVSHDNPGSYETKTLKTQFNYIRIAKIAWVVLAIALLGKVIFTYAFPSKTPLQMCQESYMTSVNAIYRENEKIAKQCINDSGNDIYKLNKCTSSPLPIPVNTCWTTLNASGSTIPLPPSWPTLRKEFGLDNCRYVNGDHRMNKYNLQWMGYDIACEKWVAFDVKSPWDYQIEKKWYGANIGNYIILKNNGDFRIVLGHTQTSRKVGEKLHRGDIIGQTNLSGLSTWIHVHIELWYKYFNLSSEAIYEWDHIRQLNAGLLNHRNWNFGQPKYNPFYFTEYNLWDPAQNDATPCIGSSGKDLCAMEAAWVRTMALTSDIRAKLWIKFWDRVKLEWDTGCEWIYEVHDEMNIRFRQDPWVLRPWTPYYIKGDLPSKPGWACYVTKL